MNKIRFGIIGLGRWPREVHIPNLNNIRDAEIVAVCDQSKENIEKAIAVIKGENPKVYSDFNDLLKNDSVDAVIVTVPNHLHTKFASAALEAGKHVFCEKPLAITIEDHKKMQRLVNENRNDLSEKKILQIGFELRYAKLIREIKRIIDKKVIGKVNMININVYRGPVLSQWRLDDSKTGGLLLELCSHFFDLISWFSESKVKSVFALNNSPNSGGQYDRAAVSLMFENGILANMDMVLFTPFKDDVSIELLGIDGILNAKLSSNEIRLFTREESKKMTIRLKQDTSIPEFGFMGARIEFEEFIRNIKNNSIPLTNADNSLESLLIAKAAENSFYSRQLELIDNLR